MNRLLLPACWLALAGLTSCKHTPTPKEQQGSQIHYDLGIQAQQAGDPQGALREFDQSIEMDPGFPDVRNARGLVLHLAFQRLDEAIAEFQLAVTLNPTFSEAKTNLGNAYLDSKRYDDAIKMYEEALNDMLYPTPFIAQGNLGWAFFKKGDIPQALDHIKASVTLNPKFCLGYKNLGIVYDSKGDTEQSCRQLAKYEEHCPEVADAYYREGLCLAKLGQLEKAKEKFAACQTKSPTETLKDDCKRLQEKLQ